MGEYQEHSTYVTKTNEKNSFYQYFNNFFMNNHGCEKEIDTYLTLLIYNHFWYHFQFYKDPQIMKCWSKGFENGGILLKNALPGNFDSQFFQKKAWF